LKRLSGLSGGIDSSVTAVIAVEALGAANVTGVAIHLDLPTRSTGPRGVTMLGLGWKRLNWRNCTLRLSRFSSEKKRGCGRKVQAFADDHLMSYVNQQKGFLINTSNKTELALGYATLYGDMAGTISPLGDLTKPEVYALARWINTERNVIPAFVMERAPSAELREHQVDPFDYENFSEIENLSVRQSTRHAQRNISAGRWGGIKSKRKVVWQREVNADYEKVGRCVWQLARIFIFHCVVSKRPFFPRRRGGGLRTKSPVNVVRFVRPTSKEN
jgi:hypothetical protein